MRLLILLLCSLPLAAAGDDPLAAIRADLVRFRSIPITAPARGATPALNIVKHQLRDWIESRLMGGLEGQRWNFTALQHQLNAELQQAGVFCPGREDCIENPLGYLNPVSLELQTGGLVVRTSAGIQVCGSDDSAYLYEYSQGKWNRVWSSEQLDYSEKTYVPQRLVEVKTGLAAWPLQVPIRREERLIATIGVRPWCTSVFHPIYRRVWYTASSASGAALLLDENELADIGSPIHARVSEGRVLFEYEIIADDALRMPQVLHYERQGGRLRHIDPVALAPRDFVSYWLRSTWDDVAERTEVPNRDSLKAWRTSYKGSNSVFTGPTRSCGSQPDVWQVTAAAKDHVGAPTYFLIRARPPFRFTMVAASDKPWRDCVEPDPLIDHPVGLFDR